MRRDYFAGKTFSHDWASMHIPKWERLFKGIIRKQVEILEIGSFEGLSAVFFLTFFKRSTITCVDTFAGSVEHLSDGSQYEADMDFVEARFDRNLAPFGARLEKRKGLSIEILPKLRREGRAFGLVYVDGDHHAANCFADASLAWQMLETDGVMILDDYRWMPDRPAGDRPRAGIDAFLGSIEGQFEEVHRSYQIIVRKTRPQALSVEKAMAGKPAKSNPLARLHAALGKLATGKR
ncbi:MULTISPECIES: class I SAM-dependent methyltransferase [unclassified Mesorhizobium]|uniref:class I SAM-dependent methyltransferase n=1 Tax=unclassified Mesorhizobium TaxID=325217 RepID=UPI00163D604D|nr:MULTISPECIES: class I SAM-dependent methyltransferase [unclassified Mesorhizobium]